MPRNIPPIINANAQAVQYITLESIRPPVAEPRDAYQGDLGIAFSPAYNSHLSLKRSKQPDKVINITITKDALKEIEELTLSDIKHSIANTINYYEEYIRTLSYTENYNELAVTLQEIDNTERGLDEPLFIPRSTVIEMITLREEQLHQITKGAPIRPKEHAWFYDRLLHLVQQKHDIDHSIYNYYPRLKESIAPIYGNSKVLSEITTLCTLPNWGTVTCLP